MAGLSSFPLSGNSDRDPQQSDEPADTGQNATPVNPPVADLVGFRLVAQEDGRAAVDFAPSSRHANAMGTLHGGVLCDIANAAMEAAYVTTLQEGETFTTLELKINFLKPVWRSRLRADGWVVKAGRTVGLTQCDIYDEGGSLVARATSACMTLRGDAAVGR